MQIINTLSCFLQKFTACLAIGICLQSLPAQLLADNNEPLLLTRPPENPVKIWKTQDSKRQFAITQAINANRQSLFESDSPTSGAKEGKVTIVEFFDYQCGHCKKMSAIIAGLKQQNPDLKIIYKNLPILNQDSLFAAKAALAANKQQKYDALHKAFMNTSTRLSKENVFNLAKNLNLDIKQLQNDINHDDVAQEISDNYYLSQKMTITGTPALIITGPYNKENKKTYFVPGSVDAQSLQKMMNEVRSQ